MGLDDVSQLSDEDFMKKVTNYANMMTEVIQGQDITLGASSAWAMISHMGKTLAEDDSLDDAMKVSYLSTMLEGCQGFQENILENLISLVGEYKAKEIIEGVRNRK